MFENLFNIESLIGSIESDGTLKLKVTRCEFCDSSFLPHKEMCPNCWNDDLVMAEVGPYGKIYSHTTIRVDTPLYKAPYIIGYIDLDDKVRLLAQIEVESPEMLQVEKRVKCVSRPFHLSDGTKVNGYKFKIVEEG